MLLSGSVLPGMGKGSCAGDAPQHCQGRPGKVKQDFVALEGWSSAQGPRWSSPSSCQRGEGLEEEWRELQVSLLMQLVPMRAIRPFITRTLLGGRGRIRARELSLGLASLGRRL